MRSGSTNGGGLLGRPCTKGCVPRPRLENCRQIWDKQLHSKTLANVAPSVAFRLTVYASTGTSPPTEASFVSSCWSGATERVYCPYDYVDGVPSCGLQLIPPSRTLLGAIVSTSGESDPASVDATDDGTARLKRRHGGAQFNLPQSCGDHGRRADVAVPSLPISFGGVHTLRQERSDANSSRSETPSARRVP